MRDLAVRHRDGAVRAVADVVGAQLVGAPAMVSDARTMPGRVEAPVRRGACLARLDLVVLGHGPQRSSFLPPPSGAAWESSADAEDKETVTDVDVVVIASPWVVEAALKSGLRPA
jgi:hypothetical protein